MGATAERAKEIADLVLNNPVEGLARAVDLADQARREGAAETLTITLRWAAWAAREVFEHDAADVYLQESIDVATAAGLDDRLAEALITRCGNHLETGQTDLALADVDQARSLDVPRMEAELAFTDGLVTTAVGRAHDAVAAYERARRHLIGDDPHLEGKICNNLGMLYTQMGRHADAATVLAHAAEVTTAASGGVLLTVVMLNQAELALRTGDPAAAMARYAEVEGLCRDLGVPLAELFREKAEALASMRLMDEAAEAARHAVHEARQAGQVTMIIADALLTLSRIAFVRGEYPAAGDTAAEAATLAREQGWGSWAAVAEFIGLEARALQEGASADLAERLQAIEERLDGFGQQQSAIEAGLLLGDACQSLGRAQGAADAYGRVATRAVGGGVLAALQFHRARAARAAMSGDADGALAECGQGMDELERYRARVHSSELRSRAAAHGRELTQLALTTALASEDVGLVWTWIERGRAGSAAPRRGLVDADVSLWLAEIRDLESAVLSEAAPGDAISRLADLERQVRERLWAADGGQEGPDQGAVTAGMAGVAAALEGRGLVQIAVVGEALVAIVIDPAGNPGPGMPTGSTRSPEAAAPAVRLVRLGAAGPVLADAATMASGLERLTTTRSPAVAAAVMTALAGVLAQLSERLWEPLDLHSGSELVICPPPALLALPWGSVPGFADLPVRVTTSAESWWASSRRQPLSDRVVLAAGPRLAGSVHEVERLQGVYVPSRPVVAISPTCAELLTAVDRAGLVHLACHGHLRTDAPAFSSLELADGPLTLHELEQIVSPAHHWVLAACNLGGPGASAAGLYGMVTTLLDGGAGAVVASTANLPDAVSADVMVALHRELATGRSMAQALWTARQQADPTTPDGYAASLMLTCFGGG